MANSPARIVIGMPSDARSDAPNTDIPQLSFVATEENLRIVAKCPKLRAPYKPHPAIASLSSVFSPATGKIIHGLAASGVAAVKSQDLDLWGQATDAVSSDAATKRARSGRSVSETVKMPDGGTVALDWFPAKPSRGQTLVLLIHGLNNSARSHYIQKAMRVFAGSGDFFCCALNMRGAGGMPLTSSLVGCLDSWQDLEHVVNYLAQRKSRCSAEWHPHWNGKICIVGYSMGGAMICKSVCHKNLKPIVFGYRCYNHSHTLSPL